jgi:hypothetical protein
MRAEEGNRTPLVQHVGGTVNINIGGDAILVIRNQTNIGITACRCLEIANAVTHLQCLNNFW